VRVSPASGLAEVAVAVANALEEAKIRAVLTGGGCATIYSGGEYQSEDLDWIIQSAPTQRELDDAMASIGFKRKVDHYVHPKTHFFIEFPRGPLAIGRDLKITPVRIRVGRRRITGLSPTDSCRDRLAAFYHWNDRQSLDTAVLVALSRRVNLSAIRKWSAAERSSERFEEFERELKVARRSRVRKRREKKSEQVSGRT
jgi:hypothetical protein